MALNKPNPTPKLSMAIATMIMQRYEKWWADHAMWTKWLKERWSDKTIYDLAPEPELTTGVIVHYLIDPNYGFGLRDTEVQDLAETYRRWYKSYDWERKEARGEKKGWWESKMMAEKKQPIRYAIEKALKRMVERETLLTASCISPQTGKDARCYEPAPKLKRLWAKHKDQIERGTFGQKQRRAIRRPGKGRRMMVASDARADVVFRKLTKGQDAEKDIRAALYGKIDARGAFLSEIHMLLIPLGAKHLRGLLTRCEGKEASKLLRRALEAHIGRLVWMRKDSLNREDGSAKNIALGTRVVTIEQRSRAGATQARILGGQHGVVEQTGTANRHAAKRAVGTIAAMQVRLDPVKR